MVMKRRPQDVGDQDWHFVAIEVAKPVIDLFEMVDVHHRQPLSAMGPSPAVPPPSAAKDSETALERLATPFIAWRENCLSNVLMVEQAGQRIAFAVVQQALVVLVDLKMPLSTSSLCGKRAGLGDFLLRGTDFVVHPQAATAHDNLCVATTRRCVHALQCTRAAPGSQPLIDADLLRLKW